MSFIDPDGQAVETVVDVICVVVDVRELWHSIKERNVKHIVINAAATVIDITATVIPFVPGAAGAIFRGVSAADKVSDAAKVADTAVDVGRAVKATNSLNTFQEAGKYGIASYRELKKAVGTNSGLEVHHLIEQRFFRSNNINLNLNDIPSIVLTPEEHRVFTNLWRDYFPYGKSNNVKIEEVFDKAETIYENYPEILDAIHVFKNKLKYPMQIKREILAKFTNEDALFLKQFGIKVKGGNVLERIYVRESREYINIRDTLLKTINACKSDIYKITNDQNKIYVYSKSEIENSNYCLLYAPIGGGYPQPENIDPNYFDITYDHIMCNVCGIPQTQIRSFRVNKVSPRPIWGFTAWIGDVLFAQEPFYREVFEPLGIPSRPVCKVSGKQYEGIVQIKMPISDEDLDLRYCAYSICKQCGAKKYSPHLRFPYFPEPRKPISDIFLTKESFGYDSGSDRQIIISTSLALELLKLKAIPLSNLVPCKKDLSQYLSQHKDYLMPFVKEGRADYCDMI